MGQCMSQVEKAVKQNEGQLKAMAESIDKDAIEVCVKEKMLEVATESKVLAAAWSAKIAAGETVEVKADDIKPVTPEAIEKDAIKLKLDAASTEAERLSTAVYVTGNEAKREAIKPRCVAEIKESLVAKKALPAIIDNAEKQLPALLTKFLENQVKAMADKATKGEPLVPEADETKIAEYRKQQAEDKKKIAEAAGGAAAAPAADAAAAPAAAAPAADAAAAPAAAAPAADAAAAPAAAPAAAEPAAAPAADVVAPAQVVVQTQA